MDPRQRTAMIWLAMLLITAACLVGLWRGDLNPTATIATLATLVTALAAGEGLRSLKPRSGPLPTATPPLVPPLALPGPDAPPVDRTVEGTNG